MAQTNGSKKIVDVSKPGETGPNATAKPVIVGHGNMIKEDPMVASSTGGDEITTEASPSDTLSKKSEKVIAAPAENKSSPQPDKTVPSEPEQSSAEDTPEEHSDNQDKISASEQAAVDAVAEQANKDKKKKAEPTDEEKARSAAIQKLIDDKKYFVSTSATRRQRKAVHSLIFLLLLVLVIAACVYLLIDAEFFDPGIKLPFEFVN